jgi:hypothetical protein
VLNFARINKPGNSVNLNMRASAVLVWLDDSENPALESFAPTACSPLQTPTRKHGGVSTKPSSTRAEFAGSKRKFLGLRLVTRSSGRNKSAGHTALCEQRTSSEVTPPRRISANVVPQLPWAEPLACRRTGQRGDRLARVRRSVHQSSVRRGGSPHYRHENRDVSPNP